MALLFLHLAQSGDNMSIYVLVQLPPGSLKVDVLDNLRGIIAPRLQGLDKGRRQEVVGVIREALGLDSSEWITANPVYNRSEGKLLLEFSDPHIENRSVLKSFFQAWRSDPEVQIKFERANTVASKNRIDNWKGIVNGV